MPPLPYTPKLSDILSPTPYHRMWTKAHHYNAITINYVHKRMPNLRRISLGLDRRPGLFNHRVDIKRVLGRRNGK